MSWFDHFADRIESVVAHAWFFAACVLLIVAWFPTLFFLPMDTAQLIVNTATTCVTFLLVALLQNTSNRHENDTGRDLAQALQLLKALTHRQRALELRIQQLITEKETGH